LSKSGQWIGTNTSSLWAPAHQEIRQPLLSAGSNDQIGIGNIGRIEVSGVLSASIEAGSRLPARLRFSPLRRACIPAIRN
jgi:hypothetical protein